MRRALASLVALAAVTACSLTTKPSDYVDPSGKAVQLVRFDEGSASYLVAAEEGVFASVGRDVVRIAKDGSGATVLARLTSEPRGLALQRPGRLLVCDADRGAFYVSTSPPFTQELVAKERGQGCLAAGASAALTVVVPELPATDGGPAGKPVVLFATPDGKVTSEDVSANLVSDDASLGPAVAVTGGVAGFVVRGQVARASGPSELCLVARSETPRLYAPKVVAAPTDPPTFVARGSGDALGLFTGAQACCNKLTCAKATRVAIPPPVDFAVTARFVYFLTDGQLARRPLASATSTSSTSEESWPFASASAFTVEPDDSAAYLALGTRLVRLALP